MKKIYRIPALIFGFAAMLGASSCGDDEESGTECCSYTGTDTDDQGNTVTYTLTACEDGTYTYSYSDGTSDGGRWDDDGDYTWDYIKNEIINEYGGSCSS